VAANVAKTKHCCELDISKMLLAAKRYSVIKELLLRPNCHFKAYSFV